MNFIASIFSSDDTRELEYIDVTGKFRFHVEPDIKGILPYHTTTIMIHCFKDDRKLCPIDVECEWYRVIEGRNYKIEDNEAESYHCSPFDIGASIKVLITSSNDDCPGTATIVFGPIKMDLSMRPHIRDKVLNGTSEFKAKLIKLDDTFINDLSDFENRVVLGKVEVVVHLCRNPDVSEKQIIIPFEKSLFFRIECDSHDPKTLIIYFEEEDRERSIKLQFLNRVARDLFILSLRVIKVLKISCVTDMVNSYGMILSKEWLPKRINRESGDEYYENFAKDTENIKCALKMVVAANKEVQADNEKYLECINMLENDLQLSITQFTNLLQDMRNRQTLDVKKYEEANSINSQSSRALKSIKNDPNSSFNIKRSSKEQNVHSRKIYEMEQLNKLMSEFESAKRINGILEAELLKLKNGGKPVPANKFGNSMYKSQLGLDPKLASHIHKSKRAGDDEDDEGDLGLSLENVLADLEDLDYKTYTITKEEIDKYKETMQLRMEFTEQKTTHDMLTSNLELVRQTKQTALAQKTTFNTRDLNLPSEAFQGSAVVSEEQLLRLLNQIIKRNHELLKQNFEASKMNLESEKKSDELIELKLKYLLKKNSTLDEQSEKAEAELEQALVDHIRELESKAPTKPSAAKGPSARLLELQEQNKLLIGQNLEKSRLIEQEKMKNTAVKADLEKLVQEKKQYAEKAEKVKKLQEEVNMLMKKLAVIQGEGEQSADPKVLSAHQTSQPQESMYASNVSDLQDNSELQAQQSITFNKSGGPKEVEAEKLENYDGGI